MLAQQAGVGSLMVKSDIESAFRLLSAWPQMQSLLGLLVFAAHIMPMGRVVPSLLEFFPIVVSVEVWGAHLSNKRVCFCQTILVWFNAFHI